MIARCLDRAEKKKKKKTNEKISKGLKPENRGLATEQVSTRL